MTLKDIPSFFVTYASYGGKSSNIQRIVQNKDGYRQRNRLAASLHQKGNIVNGRQSQKNYVKNHSALYDNANI